MCLYLNIGRIIKMKQMKQILIIGNGFDLECGLESTFKNFFNWRFNTVYKQYIQYNRDYNRDYISRYNSINWEDGLHGFEKLNSEKALVELIEKSLDGRLLNELDIPFWDCVFILAKFYLSKTQLNQWCDVENIIYNVITFAFEGKYRFKDFKTNLRFSEAQEKWDYLRSKNGPVQPLITKSFIRSRCKATFKNDIKLLSKQSGTSRLKKTEYLLTQLYEFEDRFADFINHQMHRKKVAYESAAKKLIYCLTSIPYGNLDVLSFNYSLDRSFANSLFSNDADIYLGSWCNIHGVANKFESEFPNKNHKNHWRPIFGIDNHDISDKKTSEDPRIMFTKSYRLLDNNIFSLTSSEHASYSETDLITVYGHSLNRADYSYFETIFDENDLYNSKTKLQVYYNGKENDIEEKHNCITNVVNLLNNYGQTLGDTHGENIVNKMILENRLEVLPNEKLKKIKAYFE